MKRDTFFFLVFVFSPFLLFAGDARVFAHYMTCFTPGDSEVRREIELAKSYGIEGFALNCGNWQEADPSRFRTWKPREGYLRNSDRIYAQAEQISLDFKLMHSPDGSTETFLCGNHIDQLLRYLNRTNLFRYQGKPVLSGWGGSAAKYQIARQLLREKGVDALLIPSFNAPGHVMLYSPDYFSRGVYGDPACEIDGAFHFACDGTPRELIQKNAALVFSSRVHKKISMAGACPAYNSSNLRDFHGLQGYIAMWQGIVNDQPDLVELVTWNDYNEDSNLAPSGWDGGAVIDHDESFLDVTDYFSRMYRAHGQKPDIRQDKLYIAYRTRSKHLTRAWDPVKKRWIDERDLFLQIHDSVFDRVYATTFLTAPAELTILQGEKRVSAILPAGIGHLEMEMVPGSVPHFRLVRNQEVLIDRKGNRKIIAKETEENSAGAAGNVQQRSWTFGAVAGKPSFTLKKDAGEMSFRKIGDSQQWRLADLERDGKSAKGKFAFTIYYQNQGAEDAVLTLSFLRKEDLDGTSKKQDRYRRAFFPLYLAPNRGEGPVSLLLSVPDDTIAIQIAKEGASHWSRKDPSSWDRGDVTISKIEMIRNRGFENPAPRLEKEGAILPQMVSIPAGRFSMGAKGVEPDEQPIRQVEISAFEIGKFEVTNEEFERFKPEHASKRCEYSWRDVDPVIYVSWRDAVLYCNWLSEKAGLRPVYDPVRFEIDRNANGYRLPTEAEWEYVASGRGEDRVYPWGNERPDQTRANVTPMQIALRQTAIGFGFVDGGVVPVGTYPNGASRDGVMDLAGNVSEWCFDWYNFQYCAQNKDSIELTLPKERSPRTRSRVIRGGSWGYYNGDQRVANREFNNAGYPGYVYIGFRVARNGGSH